MVGIKLRDSAFFSDTPNKTHDQSDSTLIESDSQDQRSLGFRSCAFPPHILSPTTEPWEVPIGFCGWDCAITTPHAPAESLGFWPCGVRGRQEC